MRGGACFCFFPTLSEQPSVVKGPKPGPAFLAFPVSDWFQLPLLTCAQCSFCWCLPVHTPWTGFSSSRTHRLQSVPFFLPVLQAQHLQTHNQVGPSQRYTSSILSFYMVSNYAASSWKHNLQYNFGNIFSEGISFSDCLQESKPPSASSCLFLLVFLVALSSS